jgi:hypothetical protein
MRRPAIRSLVGGAAGLAAGIIGGVTLTSLSVAGVGVPGGAAPGLEASHVPPALTLPGEPATLRYAIVCAPREDGNPCAGSGEVYVRAGHAGSYERIPLVRGDDSSEGRYFAEIPPALASSRAGFSYYAVLRDDASGASITVPAGGAAAPDRSLPLGDATQVKLGAHEFGAPRRADKRVLHASWGSEPGQAGLAGSRALGFAGPASFDVGADGIVTLLDQVNGRAERWARGRVETVPLAVSGGLADFAVEPDSRAAPAELPRRRYGEVDTTLGRPYVGEARAWARRPGRPTAAVGAVAAGSRAGDCARPRRASRARAAGPASRTRPRGRRRPCRLQ